MLKYLAFSGSGENAEQGDDMIVVEVVKIL
jgi:hypothetical protein